MLPHMCCDLDCLSDDPVCFAFPAGVTGLTAAAAGRVGAGSWCGRQGDRAAGEGADNSLDLSQELGISVIMHPIADFRPGCCMAGKGKRGGWSSNRKAENKARVELQPSQQPEAKKASAEKQCRGGEHERNQRDRIWNPTAFCPAALSCLESPLSIWIGPWSIAGRASTRSAPGSSFMAK